MKKVLFSLILLIGSVVAIAQQTKPDVLRVMVWDRPTTDNLTYKGVLPDTMRIVTMYTSTGSPVFVLTGWSQYQAIQDWFDDSTNTQSGKIVGSEYVVSYIGRFSYISRKRMRKLEGMQWVNAKAFNEKEKYTMMAEAPRLVTGKRNAKGDIVLAVAVESKPQINNSQASPPVVNPAVNAAQPNKKPAVQKKKTLEEVLNG